MPDETKKIKDFLDGPSFLKKETYPNFEKPNQPPSDEENAEIKLPNVLVGMTQSDTGDTTIQKICSRYSSMYRCIRAIVILCKYVSFLQQVKVTKAITVDDTRKATKMLLIDHQNRHFPEETTALRSKRDVKANSRLKTLVPVFGKRRIVESNRSTTTLEGHPRHHSPHYP